MGSPIRDGNSFVGHPHSNNEIKRKGNINMNAMSYTQAHAQFGKIIDQVCQDHVPLIITRPNNQAVVMISLEDYQAMEETNYLLSSPTNAKRLLESVAQLEGGKGLVKELVE